MAAVGSQTSAMAQTIVGAVLLPVSVGVAVSGDAELWSRSGRVGCTVEDHPCSSCLLSA